jgi:SnoaL-like domain
MSKLAARTNRVRFARKEREMSECNELVDRYIALWNETDAERRRALIARTFSAGASYVDPLMASEGHSAIDDMIAAAQQRFPGHSVRRAGEVDGHHDRLRFDWELAAPAGAVIAKGTDFATVEGARLAAVTGFIDQMPV